MDRLAQLVDENLQESCVRACTGCISSPEGLGWIPTETSAELPFCRRICGTAFLHLHEIHL